MEKPVSVFIHCNEGINRAPAAAALVVSKLHNSDPLAEAAVLAASREINSMFSSGTPRDRRGRRVLENLKAVKNSLVKDTLSMGTQTRHARLWELADSLHTFTPSKARLTARARHTDSAAPGARGG